MGVCPRDRALGMHATSLSPGVLRMVGLAASDFSFAAASDLLWELAAVRVETKQVERCAEALGREVAADERAVVETVPSPAPTMYLGLDGIGDRLKRAGMRWTVAGANAIIALRCCILSGRFEDFWEQRAANAA